jgi:hypothetical protein
MDEGYLDEGNYDSDWGERCDLAYEESAQEEWDRECDRRRLASSTGLNPNLDQMPEVA